MTGNMIFELEEMYPVKILWYHVYEYGDYLMSVLRLISL